MNLEGWSESGRSNRRSRVDTQKITNYGKNQTIIIELNNIGINKTCERANLCLQMKTSVHNNNSTRLCVRQ